MGIQTYEELLFSHLMEANEAISFANNKLHLFESNTQGFFSNKDMYDQYKSIFNELRSNGYSIQDSNDYALSYMLDEHKTGLKISKKETGKSDFKEQKTEKNSRTNEYQPKICP